MHSGRAKKIRRMLEAQNLNDDEFNYYYKQTKQARYSSRSSGPTKRLKTKRHKGESLLEFKRRRAKVNAAKRERKRLWRIRA